MKKINAFFFLFFLLTLFAFDGESQVSNFAKTITFDSITVSAGSCYIDHDDGTGWGGSQEDPAIVIRCNSSNGSVVYSKTWEVDIPTSGTYDLVLTAQSCSPIINSFIIDPVNILLVSSIDLYISTFERENSSCDNPNNQDCLTEGLRTLNLNVGSHSVTSGEITYHYSVTQTPSVTAGTYCGLALPIELAKFEVKSLGNYAELLWTTSSERNNDFFTIERSINGTDWEERSQITGAGNSNTELIYRTLDENMVFGTTYYKLKQTDFDGHYEYSDILSYQFAYESVNQLNIHPNPTSSDLITVTGVNFKGETLKVHDLYGHEITNQILITNTGSGVIMNISQLRAGYYLLTTDSSVTKFLKL